MEVNILTAKTGEFAREEVTAKPEDFWDYYLTLLEVRQITHLTTREKRLMVYVLSQPDSADVSYFSGKQAKEVRIALGHTAQELSRMKRSLIVKGFLTEGDSKGEAWPSPSLKSLKSRSACASVSDGVARRRTEIAVAGRMVSTRCA